nr:MAG TPA: hypothetical protein [Caudoviricetes sp.]
MGYQKNSEDFRQSFLILIEWKARIWIAIIIRDNIFSRSIFFKRQQLLEIGNQS